MKKYYIFFYVLGCTIFLSAEIDVVEKPQTDISEKKLYGVDRYYSEKNLSRINEINNQLKKIQSEGGLEKPVELRQKHAPLVILADFFFAEVELIDSIKALFHDAILSSLSPVILMSATLLKGVPTIFPAVFFEKARQKYQIYHVAGTQLYVLIPQWFETFYIDDFGFKRQNLLQISFDQRSIINSCNAVLGGLKNKNLRNRFIDDLKSLFSLHNDGNLLPVWDIWFVGHGNAGSSIAGFSRDNFLKILQFFSKNIDVGTLLIESCFAGGENSSWLNSEIEKTDPLKFHLITGSIGNAPVTLNFNTIIDPGNSFIFADAYIKTIMHYFNDAAFFISNDSRSFEKFVLKHLIRGVSDKEEVEEGSLHRSENIPQFRAKNAKKFKHFNDLEGFFIVDKKNKNSEIFPGEKIHTVILQSPSIESITLSAIKIRKNKMYHVSVREYIKSIPEVETNAVAMYQALVVSNMVEACTCKKIILDQNDYGIGILRFLQGFLTNKLQSFPPLKINYLEGFNDFSVIENEEVKSFFNEIMDGQQRLVFENVHIVKDGEVFLVSADIQGKKYTFYFDSDLDKTMQEGHHSFDFFDNCFSNGRIFQLRLLWKHKVYSLEKDPEMYRALQDLFLGDDFIKQTYEDDPKEMESFIQGHSSFDLGNAIRFIDKDIVYWNVPLYEVVKRDRVEALKYLLQNTLVAPEIIQNAILYVRSKDALMVLLAHAGDPLSLHQETGIPFGQMLLFQCPLFEKDKAVDLIAYLIELGIDINSVNNAQESILFVARNDLDVLRVLLDHGASPQVANQQGFTVMHSFAYADASKKKHLQLLLHYGGEVDRRVLQAFLQNNQYPNPILELLVQYSSDDTLYPFRGNYWIESAINNSYTMANQFTDMMRAGDDDRIIQLLESSLYGSDINMRNGDGNYLIHEAVLNGRKRIIQYLLSQGARSFVRNREGKTPIELAFQVGNEEIIAMF